MRRMGEQFLSGCVYAPENIPHGTHAMLHPYFCILPSNRILIRADLRIQRFFFLLDPLSRDASLLQRQNSSHYEILVIN